VVLFFLCYVALPITKFGECFSLLFCLKQEKLTAIYPFHSKWSSVSGGEESELKKFQIQVEGTLATLRVGVR